MSDKRDDQADSAHPSENAETRTYDVGYGRPPQATKFQAGRSGNPKGRPKGSKNFKTLFEEELAQPITLTENGKRKRMPKRQALVKQMINKALSNDAKAAAIVLDQIRRSESQGEAVPTLDIRPLQHPDLLANIVRRIRLNEPSGATDAPTSEENAQ
jgi:hypothetical protein